MAEVRDIIGIDPGMTTGVANYAKDKQAITFIQTTDFWGCIDFFKAHDTVDRETVLVIVEAPIKTAMYAKQEGNVKNAKYGNRMMANAASNAREAELLADGIERLGFQVTRIRPKRFKREDGSSGKVNAEEVRRLTGFEGSTNQHTRDAILLCHPTLLDQLKTS